jgi:hypothetical protein
MPPKWPGFNKWLEKLGGDNYVEVYHIRFTEGAPAPDLSTVDDSTLYADLTVGGPGVEAVYPPPGPLTAIGPDGLGLAFNNTPPGTTVGLAVGLKTPIRPLFRRFYMSAHFTLPVGLGPTKSNGTKDRWAATLAAYVGNPVKPVGATHQVVGGQIHLGSGLPDNPDPASSEFKTSSEAYGNSIGGEFVLSTAMDCDAGTGVSDLWTPFHTWNERKWTNAFPPGQPDMLAVGLAMNLGYGAPAVTVKEWTIAVML